MRKQVLLDKHVKRSSIICVEPIKLLLLHIASALSESFKSTTTTVFLFRTKFKKSQSFFPELHAPPATGFQHLPISHD